MPVEPAVIGICVGGQLDGMKVYDLADIAACRDADGEVVNNPHPASSRVMEMLFTEHVAAAETPSNDAAEVNILYFPLCNMHRRFPHSQVAVTLDALDVDASRGISRILKEDNELRRRVLRFVLHVTYIVAKATALETSAGTSPTPPVPVELVETGRELGTILASRVDDQSLADMFARLIDKSVELDGANVLDIIRLLTEDRQAAAQ